MKTKILTLGLVLGLAVATTGFGSEVEARLKTGALSFKGGSGFTNAVLMITGPNEFEAEETASRGLPVFRVQGGRMRDGFYQYTLSAATDTKVQISNSIDNGRGSNARDHTFQPFHLSGMFEVRQGRIVPEDEMAVGADGDSEESN